MSGMMRTGSHVTLNVAPRVPRTVIPVRLDVIHVHQTVRLPVSLVAYHRLRYVALRQL